MPILSRSEFRYFGRTPTKLILIHLLFSLIFRLRSSLLHKICKNGDTCDTGRMCTPKNVAKRLCEFTFPNWLLCERSQIFAFILDLQTLTHASLKSYSRYSKPIGESRILYFSIWPQPHGIITHLTARKKSNNVKKLLSRYEYCSSRTWTKFVFITPNICFCDLKQKQFQFCGDRHFEFRPSEMCWNSLAIIFACATR